MLLATATSTFGSMLKIDSSKKVCKKLQGAAANTASWARSVGNENGEVLQSVLTASEALESLQKLADGLMDRYERARKTPPSVLYMDRDCCSGHGRSKFHNLFGKWPNLLVRLDIWHFMQRLALGCSSESHPLYGLFMSHLSACIFEWDQEDFDHLISAKRAELITTGVPSPSLAAVRKAITSEEMARHCRRKTRGVEQTISSIEALLLSLSSATDMLGILLIKPDIKDIWAEQKKHVECIQDPPGIQLYTIKRHLTKGGVQMPVYRCGRGSTSLESFHLHLSRFIPGTSANAVNLQAYLLEGITRWNMERARAATKGERSTLRTFDSHLKYKIDALNQAIHSERTSPDYCPPLEYTGELFGVEYLYDQSGNQMVFKDSDLDDEIDEGFQDFDETTLAEPDAFVPAETEDPIPVLCEDQEEEEEDLEEELEGEEV